MRLTSDIWVSAFLRRCMSAGAFAVVEARGAREAGAIFIKAMRFDGTGRLYGPAPQAVYGDGAERLFAPMPDDAPRPEADISRTLERETRIDPDIWIVTVEDADGRQFLDDDLARTG